MMRHSPFLRLLNALMGVLFAFNFAQPVWMSGMDMNGMNMPGMSMAGMSEVEIAAHCEAMAGEVAATQTVAHDAGAHAASTHASNAAHEHGSQSSAPADKDEECKQHECCASALVHASLSPVASLSWLPEHVISQQTPESIDAVVDTDVQLRLPFANGPPRSVIA